MDLSYSKSLPLGTSQLQAQPPGSEFPECELFWAGFPVLAQASEQQGRANCPGTPRSRMLRTAVAAQEQHSHVSWACRRFGRATRSLVHAICMPFAQQSLLLGAGMAGPFQKDFQGRCCFVFLIIHVFVWLRVMPGLPFGRCFWSKLGDQELHSATAVFEGALPLLSRQGKARRAVHAQKLIWIAAS